MKRALAGLILALPCWFAGAVSADDAAARNHYMLQCQGCHLASGLGLPGEVPGLNGLPGKLLEVRGGREFLVRVPGAANSPLDDAELAATLNWMLREFSAATLAADFTPFSAAEVARLRAAGALVDIKSARSGLLDRLTEQEAARY